MTLRLVQTPRAQMLDYLAKRGINEAQADAAGFEPLDPAQTMHVAGADVAWGRASFKIPYRDLDGRPTEFFQLRFLGNAIGFKPTKGRKEPLRYWQASGSSTPAYLPPGFSWRELAYDVTADLVFTESAVKATAACVRGIPTVGLTSVDTWHVGGDKDRLVPMLDEIVVKRRNIAIVYDSDAASKPGVQRAEAELCSALERRGAFVQIVRLPPAADGTKEGLDDYLVREGPDEFRKLCVRGDRLPESLDSGAAIFDTEYPPVEFAIAPYLPKGELIEIHGPHGQFKSTIMLYACLSVATGEPWGGVPVKQGKAVFISLEDSSATLARRVKCWVEGGAECEAIRENFHFLGREKAKSLALTVTDFGRAHPRVAVVDHFAKLCAGAELIVLETVSRLHPGEETNEAFAVFANAAEDVAMRTGAAVVIVGHVPKEAARNGSPDSYGLRGGGALADAARSVLAVVRDGEGKPRMDGTFDAVRLVHVKSTHAPRGADLAWRPTSEGGAVFLQAMTAAESASDLASRLYEKILVEGAAGITTRELTRSLPAKGREEKRAEMNDALDALVADGRVVQVFPPGKTGPRSPTFIAARIAAGLAPTSPAQLRPVPAPARPAPRPTPALAPRKF